MTRLSIPVTTLPRIRHLLSAADAQKSSGKLWCYPGQKASFHHGSAWGISNAIRMVLECRKKSRGVVFLPDYFCNLALMPLRRQQVRLVFYPVTENLNPDWSLMDKLVLQCGCPDIFIQVHYFGFISEITEALHFCREVGAELLEDGAHVLLPFNEIGKYSWGTVYSPYKLLPVPKIGILVTSERIEIDGKISSRQKRIDIDTYKWIGKRLLQSFLTDHGIPWRNQQVEPFELDTVEKFKANPFFSTFPLKLLRVLEPELENYKAIRRKNYKTMEEAVAVGTDVVVPLFSSLPENACPYLFPMRLHEDIIRHVYHILNRVGIPAQTWPDLPPEVKQNPSVHITAIKLRKSLLTIPIHQSLTNYHIEYIARNLRSSILEALSNK